MNRKTKGALAAGAGAILLLGGAGSLALWSDSDALSDDAITTGDFGLNCTGGAWNDVSLPANTILHGTAIDPATDLMVPGDTWEYTATCTPKATGKNMHAVLSADLTGTGGTLPAGVTVTSSINGLANGATLSIPNPQATTPPSYPVSVKVEFSGAVTGTTSINSGISVQGMTIKLDQVRP